MILDNLPNSAIDRYRDILNNTFSMGYFPKVAQNGIMALIGKPGKDLKDPQNYRPKTLLEVPGKILERIINNRLTRFYEENELYHRNQYGFRRKKGTDMAITRIYETIVQNQK